MKKHFLLFITIFCALFLFGCDKKQEECDHIYKHYEKLEPTCTEPGHEEYDACVLCGESNYQEIKALGHDLVHHDGQAPKCDEAGYDAYDICSRCDYTSFKAIEAIGHSMVTVPASDATCKHEGYPEHQECEICGWHEEYVSTPKTDHNLRLISSTGASTTTCAYKKYICDDCKEEVYEYDNPLKKSNEELDELNILLIGNSYTNYNTLMTCLKHLIEGQGFKVNVVKVAYGSQYLYDYIEGDDGDYYNKVVEAVSKTQFDVAFLQEQSSFPINNTPRFYDSTRKLVKYLGDKGITSIMYATWAHPDGNSGLNSNFTYTSECMTQKLTAAYEAIAFELGITTAPAGSAFREVYINHPEDKALLYASISNNHPSKLGTYIAALSMYSRLFGRKVTGVNYTFEDYMNDTDITWHSTKEIKYTAELQKEAEDAVNKVVFGPSIVTEEYKLVSSGVEWTPTSEITVPETIEMDAAIPTEWIDVTYSTLRGHYAATKDANGITSFTNDSNVNSKMIIQNELLEDGGTLSFDWKFDGNYTGSDGYGILAYMAKKDEVKNGLLVGRSKAGALAGGIWNNDTYTGSASRTLKTTESLLTEANKTYRVKIVIDKEANQFNIYVDGKLSGYIIFKKLPDVGIDNYFGLASGKNGQMTVSNIQVNGKGLRFTDVN